MTMSNILRIPLNESQSLSLKYISSLIVFTFCFLSTAHAQDRPPEIRLTDFDVIKVENSHEGRDIFWGAEGTAVTTAVLRDNKSGMIYSVGFPFGTSQPLIEDYVEAKEVFYEDTNATAKMLEAYLIFEKHQDESVLWDMSPEDTQKLKSECLKHPEYCKSLVLRPQPIGAILSFVYSQMSASK